MNAPAIPKAQFDWKPLALLTGVMALGLPMMISSPTIMPPMVMRICFRCWP